MILFIPIVGVARIIIESRKDSDVYTILVLEREKRKKAITETDSVE